MSDEAAAGYFGIGLINDTYPSIEHSGSIWVDFALLRRFKKPVTLRDIYRDGPVRPNAFAYSRTIRPVAPIEVDYVLSEQEGAATLGMSEQAQPGLDAWAPHVPWSVRKVRVRNLSIRIDMLRWYGPGCVFTGQLSFSIDGRRCDTQVGHLVSLEYGGPDIIQNVLPMSASTNWHWDEGLISLTNGGRILVARNASPQSKALYEEGRIVKFGDSKVWPKAEYIEWHRNNIFERGRQPGLQHR